MKDSELIDQDSAVIRDRLLVANWLESPPDTESVAHFVAGPGIQKLDLSFDPGALRQALSAC